MRKESLSASPLRSCCGAQNLLLAFGSPNFDRCHSFLLASPATGSARKRPHLSTSPYMLFSATLNIITQTKAKCNTFF